MIEKGRYLKVNKILMESKKPSEEIKKLIEEGEFNDYPFNKIKDLKNIEQNLKFHPEGNVLNHVLLVVDEAAKNRLDSKDKEVLMWGALLHDIGKITTTKVRHGRITSYNHDIEGEKTAYEFLDNFTNNEEFKSKVSKMVRYHMQPLFFDKNLPFFEPKKMLEECDYNELALLSLSDRLGRGNLNEEIIKEEINKINNFRNYCKNSLE